MRIWKAVIACTLAGTVTVSQLQSAAAAPMPTNVATMKAMAPELAAEAPMQVHWRGGGWGWGGAAIAGALIGGAIASSAYRPYYYGEPYYYPAPYYGYYAPPVYYAPPAYYGYGPYYGYRARPYYGYRYGYYRPVRVYHRHYHRRHW